MKLYHGSNVEIEEIDLSKSKTGKDFGCGFYLNPNKKQAQDLAEQKANFLGGEPVVSVFEFDIDKAFKEGLKIKIFEDYSEDWAEFIALNRRNKSTKQVHDYDIIIGPIADDNVGVQIRRFTNGYISSIQLIEERRFKKPTTQYFFANDKSIKFLKKLEI